MTNAHEKSGNRQPTPMWWRAQKREAKSYMAERKTGPGHTALIAVAGQHPAIEGIYPNKEYQLRLDKALAVAEDLRREGQLSQFCLLTSRIRDEKTGIADKASMADIGLAYLAVNGVPTGLLHREWNAEYKPEGVVSGGDEAFVAASAFRDNPEFNDLIVVASPGQLGRFRLNFTANGVYPSLVIPEDVEKLDKQHHGNPLWQSAFIAYTYLRDPTWQGGSFMLESGRKKRLPPDGNDSQISLEELVDLYRERFQE